ncbi:hypothetical protein ZIOFF_069097 [Zingiber officinale]|uniref:Uncharacterized protein n=1 Tax=Zingiber officinale TaxID=94328 RepID=A0A8J5EU20_ZINOF|nr:hypothetical protein ZIOFF_069097 [Zingiber officinale]
MAGAKMVVVAFLLVAVFVFLSAPAAEAGLCFPDCYSRCANGKIGNVGCSTMCAQACVVPNTANVTILIASEGEYTGVYKLPVSSMAAVT